MFGLVDHMNKEQTDPVGYSDIIARVTRGSRNTQVKYLRSANRMAMLRDKPYAMTGFPGGTGRVSWNRSFLNKDEYVVSFR